MLDKVQAVYALREAAETNARIEEATQNRSDTEARLLRLDARVTLEQRTREAIEACVHCGREHCEDGHDDDLLSAHD
jgi:hypothetical protein